MRFIRYAAFCVFFACGIGAIVLAIRCDEVADYYKSRDLLNRIRADNERIRQLDSDYQSQMQQIQQDPNVILRLEHIALGSEPNADGIAFPRASQEQLAAAKRVFYEGLQFSEGVDAVPKWVRRCSEPRFRYGLFFAGAGLILITFMFFGTPGADMQQEYKDS